MSENKTITFLTNDTRVVLGTGILDPNLDIGKGLALFLITKGKSFEGCCDRCSLTKIKVFVVGLLDLGRDLLELGRRFPGENFRRSFRNFSAAADFDLGVDFHLLAELGAVGLAEG